MKRHCSNCGRTGHNVRTCVAQKKRSAHSKKSGRRHAKR